MSPPDDFLSGRRNFLLQAAAVAQGSPVTAPRLGPGPLPIAPFRLFIRKPRVQMPPYSVAILSEADVDDIYAYVSSRAAPAASERLPD